MAAEPNDYNYYTFENTKALEYVLMILRRRFMNSSEKTCKDGKEIGENICELNMEEEAARQ